MTKFFNNCTTAEELKSKYRELCKKFHPDNGGSEELFKQMKQEFEQLWEDLQDVHKTMQGKKYTSDKSKRTYKSASEFMDMVDFLIHNLKVTVEINGSFFHIWGIERTDKERQAKLKEYVAKLPKLKLQWQQQKGCWRIFPADYVKKTNKTWSMDAIRNGFGSTVYKPSENDDYRIAIEG